MNPSDLDRFKVGGFPDDYPANVRTFYSPVDDCHGVILAVLDAVTSSAAIAMYGFDDDNAADKIKALLAHPTISVLLTFDSSQAGGVHEREILAREDYPNSIVAVGRSEKNRIMHMKCLVIDGLITVQGSTNWSADGEGKQDNELTVVFDRAHAHYARTRIDAIHASMLAKSAGS